MAPQFGTRPTGYVAWSNAGKASASLAALETDALCEADETDDAGAADADETDEDEGMDDEDATDGTEEAVGSTASMTEEALETTAGAALDAGSEATSITGASDDATDAVSTGSSGAAARRRSDDAEDEGEEDVGRKAEVSKASCRSRKCARSMGALQECWTIGGCPTTNPKNEPATNHPSAVKTGPFGTFQACAMCVFISYYYTTKLLIYQ